MFSLLLVIIYLAFISLGLPDSLLGSAWPVMYHEFQVPISYAGIITMIISAGTIISSLMSDRLTRRFGVGLVTAISVLMTAIALFGFSVSNSFIIICFWAIPYGLGAGAVDAALNNYVALHYAPRHMSWLHCFWGVGAAVSPYIMSFALFRGYGWNKGYLIVAIIQIVITILLFISLPLWKKKTVEEVRSKKGLGIFQAFKIKGVAFACLTFLAYCALEATTGLWASSYLVEHRAIKAEIAAMFASLFYLGITLGRFLNGFLADRIAAKTLIRIGIIVIITGILLTGIPFAFDEVSLVGLVIIGLGCAPVYPSTIHLTPSRFGKENSQAIIGIQMASAYIGTTFIPPLFGLLADKINIGIYPLFLLFFAITMLLMSEVSNKKSMVLK
ncbi:MAG: MFS transporter [Bacilli bacterium]|nr:MFS transporter [Bacilli bacterium]